MFFLCVIKQKCQGNRNLIAFSKNTCACGLCEMTGALVRLRSLIKQQKSPTARPPPPIWKMMAFCDTVQLYIIYLLKMVDWNNGNTYVTFKEFYWSCIMCLTVFLALGLMFNLLLRSINLTLYFKNLFLLSSRILTVTPVLLLSYIATLYIL